MKRLPRPLSARLRHRLLQLGALVVILAPADAARAAIDRYAILVGNNRGAQDEARLRFAETDAAKVHAVLKDLGGFPPENMVLLNSERPTTVRRTLIAMNDRIRGSLSAGRQAMLMVYYSGHADAEALHLGDERLDLRELEQLVRGSAANVRLLILDACRSGALTQGKGGTRAPPFAIQIEQRLAGEGAVFLTSSAATEEAQESDAIGGSFFTHYLVSGLLGAADVNGDGQVSLDEAYRFAYESTLRASSRTLAGMQHPTFRYELRGQGSMILTTPVHATDRAQVLFPRGLTFLITDANSNGAVMAEVGALDAARRLSVRPGRYFVRGRSRDYLLEGTIALEAGATRVLTEAQLERVEYARLVRKGGAERPARAIELAYRGRTSLWSDGSLCHGLAAGLNLSFTTLTATARLGGCRSRARRDTFVATHDSFDLELGVWHEWDLRHLTFGIGAQGAFGVVHQHFETRGIAPDRWVAQGELGVAGRISVPVGRRTFVLVELGASTLLLNRDGGPQGDASFGAVPSARGLAGFGFNY